MTSIVGNGRSAVLNGNDIGLMSFREFSGRSGALYWLPTLS